MKTKLNLIGAILFGIILTLAVQAIERKHRQSVCNTIAAWEWQDSTACVEFLAE